MNDTNWQSMKERLRKLRGSKLFFVCVTLSLGFLVLYLFPKARVLTFFDLRNMQIFTSAAGNFSMEMPKRWRHADIRYRRQPRPNVYMEIDGNIWSSGRYSGARIMMSARAEVTMAPRPQDSLFPFPQELGDELTAKINAFEETRREVFTGIAAMGIHLDRRSITEILPNHSFEVVMIRGRTWAKTTLTDGTRARIYWQTVDERSNHYTVMFETSNISLCEPIFDRMIKSFSLNSR